MKRTCVQCKKEFELTSAEISFFKRKKLQLPKRCKECRELNKQNKQGSASASINTAVSEIAGVSDITQIVKKSYKKNKMLTVVVAAVVVVALVVVAVFFKDDLFSALKNEKAPDAVSDSLNDDIDSPKTTDEDNGETKIEITYNFRNQTFLEEHFEKHKADTGCESIEEYLERANAVIADPESLMGEEKADGDDGGGDTVYYLESTNEIVFLSSDGYIRTYFKPQRGMDYFEDNVVEALDNVA